MNQLLTSVAATTAPPAHPVVAVIDDDIRFIRFVERLLAAENIEARPITTLDIDEAVRVVGDGQCSAALVDVYMYGSALGFKLIERLRECPATANLPIIVTSGAKREVGRSVEFLQANHCSVLLKPFENDELLERVRDAHPARVA